MLTVPADHRLGNSAAPRDLTGETLITYPVAPERLDVFTRFLVPAHCLPKRHRTVETTGMMLQLVVAHRGVSAMPDWILREEGAGLPIRAVRLGQGIGKGLHIGVHRGEETIGYIAGFLALARATGNPQAGPGAPSGNGGAPA